MPFQGSELVPFQALGPGEKTRMESERRKYLGSRLIVSLGRELITRLRRLNGKERKYSYRRKVRLIAWLDRSLPIITNKRVYLRNRNRNWVRRILLNITRLNKENRYRNRGTRSSRNYRRIRIVLNYMVRKKLPQELAEVAGD